MLPIISIPASVAAWLGQSPLCRHVGRRYRPGDLTPHPHITGNTREPAQRHN